MKTRDAAERVVEASGGAVVDAGVEAARMARSATVRALQQVLEVLDGRRPNAHLTRWTSAEVVDRLTGMRRRPTVGAGGEASRLVRVHLQMHGHTRASYFGTFVHGSRVRAIAGRGELLELPPHGSESGAGRQTRWMIVELAIV